MGGDYGGTKLYPIKLSLPIEKMGSCENTDLKKQKHFFVRKSVDAGMLSQIRFDAVLTKNSYTVLAELMAKSGGVCNTMETFEGSRRCGLASELMKLCFDDDDVGEVDVGSHRFAESYPLLNRPLDLRERIKRFCEHLVFLSCDPERDEGVPAAICSAYLNAAKLTGHQFMITYPTLWKGVNVIPVWLALKYFKASNNGPDRFLKINGDHWFFCRCKESDMRECNNKFN